VGEEEQDRGEPEVRRGAPAILLSRVGAGHLGCVFASDRPDLQEFDDVSGLTNRMQ